MHNGTAQAGFSEGSCVLSQHGIAVAPVNVFLHGLGLTVSLQRVITATF